jgi:hypothetical protein
MAAYATMYAGALLLAMLQLLPAISFIDESVRAEFNNLENANFPWQPLTSYNTIFGNIFGIHHISTDNNEGYYFRTDQITLFMGISAFFFFFYAAISRFRKLLPLLLIITLTFLLAWSEATPLAKYYKYIPFFSKLIATSKFIYPLYYLLILVIAFGFEKFLADKLKRGWLITGLVYSTLIAGIALFLRFMGIGLWQDLVLFLVEARIIYIGSLMPGTDGFAMLMEQSKAHCDMRMVITAAVALLTGAFFIWHKKRARLYPFLLFVITVELMLFSKDFIAKTDKKKLLPPVVGILKQLNHPKYTVYALPDVNWHLLARTSNIEGNSTTVNPLRANHVLKEINSNNDLVIIKNKGFRFKKNNNLLRIRGVNHIVLTDGDGSAYRYYKFVYKSLPHFSLFNKFKILKDDDRVLEEMKNPAFDPEKTLLLQEPPLFLPVKGNAGPKNFVNSRQVKPGYYKIDLYTSTPALLYIRENNLNGWQIVEKRPGKKISRIKEKITPANYMHMAISVPAGRHHYEMRYRPRSWVIGKSITFASLSLYLIWLIAFYRRKPKKTSAPPGQA